MTHLRLRELKTLAQGHTAESIKAEFNLMPTWPQKKKKWTSQVAQMVKCLSTMQETQVQALGWEDSLENETAIHSSTIAWKIP